MAVDPYRYFRPEAKEILEQFSRGTLDLEKGSDVAATVQKLLRLAHTLKGAARIVKQNEIATEAHAIEDVLMPFRDTAEAVAQSHIDAVLEHVDAIATGVAALSAPGEGTSAPDAAPSAQTQAAVSGDASQPVHSSVRTDISELDTMLDGVAEARALMGGLRGATEGMDEISRTVSDLVEKLEFAQISGAGRRASLDDPLSIAEKLRRRIGVVERVLDTGIDRVDRELRQLREAAERLRLVPAADMFTSLERIARDTALAQGKKITFSATSDDIRLDTRVLECLQHAFIQIVRNAVAHGIETPDARQAVGKPQAGAIALSVTRRGRRIVLTCTDDGRGIDLNGVRAAAQKRGLFDMRNGLPDERETLNLLLRGGISTSGAVTEQSGRGVGLDIVREAIAKLGGAVECKSETGCGTSFEVIIPPSLAAMDALFVDTGETGIMAVPLSAVRATLRLLRTDITRTENGASILFGDVIIPFAPLSAILHARSATGARNWATFIVAFEDTLAAIGVERLLGTASIVTRPLPRHMSASPLVTAVSLDADGNPQLVLDAEKLVEAARNGADALDEEEARTEVLVVDDSLTTRMLEQSILESAGYAVDTATSGEDALVRVGKKRYALMLVDVEMPGMDGFTFMEHIRADARTRDIPAILVTSLNEPQHRQRGRDVGAQGYIVKSEFDQSELLEMIRPLVA